LNDAVDVRIGVVGTRARGAELARLAGAVGLEVVGVCGLVPAEVARLSAELGARGYLDYDALLDSGLDAVVLANDFDAHAPLAIAALDRGVHVLSETAACATLAEGVALVEAVERSGAIYMLAENYAYTPFAQELRRSYQEGELGPLVYAESESVEAVDLRAAKDERAHWRNRIKGPQYCTHALAPLVYATGLLPERLSATVLPYGASEEELARARETAAGRGAVIVLELPGGARARVLTALMPGEQRSWVRLHGERGLIESLRGGDPDAVRLRREGDEPVEKVYTADWPWRADGVFRAGPVGSDVFMLADFARAVRTGAQPFLDVYRGVAMSVVGLVAVRSALEDSRMVAVPDFRAAAARAAHAADDWNPALV
jgi:predicted dehydrogenase